MLTQVVVRPVYSTTSRAKAGSPAGACPACSRIAWCGSGRSTRIVAGLPGAGTSTASLHADRRCLRDAPARIAGLAATQRKCLALRSAAAPCWSPFCALHFAFCIARLPPCPLRDRFLPTFRTFLPPAVETSASVSGYLRPSAFRSVPLRVRFTAGIPMRWAARLPSSPAIPICVHRRLSASIGVPVRAPSRPLHGWDCHALGRPVALFPRYPRLRPSAAVCVHRRSIPVRFASAADCRRGAFPSASTPPSAVKNPAAQNRLANDMITGTLPAAASPPRPRGDIPNWFFLADGWTPVERG